MRMLIVEDELTSQKLFQMYLAPYGQCDHAENGNQALQAFTRAWEEGQPYQLICLDIMMPGMDGREVLKSIRKIEAEQRISERNRARIIMITVMQNKNATLDELVPLCDAFLSKPVKKSHLLETIGKLGLLLPLRVLIAEDDNTSRRMLEVLLGKWGYSVVSACNGNDAWKILQQANAPQMIILDWMMPGMDGVEVCRRIRENRNQNDWYKYVIMLTAKSSSQDVLEGMKAGADDYIVKPFNPVELQVRLNVGKRIVELQSELIAARETMRFQATHDMLTTVWNRNSILELLEAEIQRARRSSVPLGVAIVDIDHFKSINDTYGHPIGDLVIRETTHRIQTSLRRYDVVGRYGGEEFLIILPDTPAGQVPLIAERIRQAIDGTPFNMGGHCIQVTISIGTISAGQGDLKSDIIISKADEALYRAKNCGRNRVEACVYEG